jgi:hypothetical protein
MAWSTPLTAVSNATLTAAQWNASVRDNLLETAAAKATTSGYHFVSTGSNALAERAILGATVNTLESTTNSSFVDLATPGPQVTLTTGTKAIVWVNARPSNNTASSAAFASFAVSGATTRAAAFEEAMYGDWPDTAAVFRASTCTLVTGLTAGSNTFKMVYRADGGTASFAYRHIVVMAL